MPVDLSFREVIDELTDERMHDEAELYDHTYHMWESGIPCPQCGSRSRHGVPAEWTACVCGNEDF